MYGPGSPDNRSKAQVEEDTHGGAPHSLAGDSIDIGRATIRQRARDLLQEQERQQSLIDGENERIEFEARRDRMLARAANVFREGDEDLDGADPILVSIYNTFGTLRDVENYHEFDVDEWGPVHTALVEDLRLASQAGNLFVLGPACQKCGGEFYRRIATLEDVAQVFEYPERQYHINCPGDPHETRKVVEAGRIARPFFPTVGDDGPSDAEMIVHNLAVIARQLDQFFDCGASQAGRGI